jgi:hypothetical protein
MAETVKKAKAPAKPRKSAAKTTAAPVEVPHAAETRASKPVSHDEIRRLAHQFWAERGYQMGSPEKDWLRAEQELLKRAS